MIDSFVQVISRRLHSAANRSMTERILGDAPGVGNSGIMSPYVITRVAACVTACIAAYIAAFIAVHASAL
ncbi:MAG TPA: hypothetical protein VFE79_17575 [Paraburkholderia sp.]|jgi:hypothetical protein|nr:hypothetical protein [Paraburkholderia sp.]